MAKTFWLFLFGLFCSIPCSAETPAWDFFAGYSFQRVDVRQYYKSTSIIYTFRDRYINMDGFELSITENMNRWFGGTLQFTGHFETPVVTGFANSKSSNRERTFSIMYGPRFSHRMSFGMPFGQVLFGAGHTSVAVIPTGPHASDTTFEMAVGGGFDLNLGRKVAIRALQVQYLPTNQVGTKKDKFQASAGIVFNLGKLH